MATTGDDYTYQALTVPASWPQLSYGPDRAGYQPNETWIGTGNVGTLSQ